MSWPRVTPERPSRRLAPRLATASSLQAIRRQNPVACTTITLFPFPGAGTQTDINQCPPGPLPVDPGNFSAPRTAVHAFHIVGFIQSASLPTACPGVVNPSQFGGTVVVNGITITIPCNSVVQFPANTFTWADMFNPAIAISTQVPLPTLTLPLTGAAFGAGVFQYPSTEITIDGNMVGNTHIAGLVYIAQQSLNMGVGYIVGIGNATGTLLVSSSPAGAPQALLQLNDPIIPALGTGLHSVGQSPDTRFSVDQVNPTIHSGTGYPMCIPRSAADPRCPALNRPTSDGISACRTFQQAQFIPAKGGDLFPTPIGQPCASFVMKPLTVLGPVAARLATDPDSREQAPFMIGDYIQYSGTVIQGSQNGPLDPNTGLLTDTISVNTITANVGIFTQPNSLPSYITIDQFGIGSGPDVCAGVKGCAPRFNNGLGFVPEEVTNRMFLEARTTDLNSIVDIYFVDINAVTGAQTYRWLTPVTMTGEGGAIGANGLLIDGGITTQQTGAQLGRARIRAVKADPNLVTAPTRYMGAAVRSLCDPSNINSNTTQVGANGLPVVGTSVPCVGSAIFANGLQSGRYVAPQFGFIFPENVIVGDPIIPNPFWMLPFIVFGEGPGTGPLIPQPW